MTKLDQDPTNHSPFYTAETLITGIEPCAPDCRKFTNSKNIKNYLYPLQQGIWFHFHSIDVSILSFKFGVE